MPSPVCFDASTLINFHEDGSTMLLAKHFRGRAYVARIQSLLGSVARHRGEAEAMVICEDRRAVFATDDRGAALVAQSRGLRTASTIEILNALVAKTHLSPKQAVEIAQRMQRAGQNVDVARIVRL